ncbi:MAG: T9SS type A sorting domain-containing protein [candidate division KSB1 bacterium]|nr:T9SS type A sorting domain-containing protein [candidate division KSB1 bacterium]MDZ7304212.1 T9SS type A sorting domain-containing protein [candidate division KSB1 bacterium]MDZ7313418.1 T9SS type A sorting domain-containing protein [candidate division KSB1 bacterium]
MKSNWIFVCLLLLLSLTVYSGGFKPSEFEIKIDAVKDPYYSTLTGPNDGRLWIPSQAFNDNGPQPLDDIDLSANWYSAWDSTYLYIYEEISDDIVNQNSATWYQNDCLDLKIDPDISAPGTGSSSVFTCTMGCMDSVDVAPSVISGVRNLVEGWFTTERPTPEDYARTLTDTGYVLELRLKWKWIATSDKGPISPKVGDTYGFAIMNHDNDSNTRDGSIEWAARLTDQVWNNCNYHGYIELLEDHKIKYVPESLRDPLIVNPNPDMYIPPTTAVSQKPAVVKNFALFQNYPNPFNPVTTISFNLPRKSKVNITVYDVLGHEVVELLDKVKPAGQYNVQFDGANLSSGIYVCRMVLDDNQVLTRKMMLMK